MASRSTEAKMLINIGTRPAALNEGPRFVRCHAVQNQVGVVRLVVGPQGALEVAPPQPVAPMDRLLK
jgi:hypothetical protein